MYLVKEHKVEQCAGMKCKRTNIEEDMSLQPCMLFCISKACTFTFFISSTCYGSCLPFQCNCGKNPFSPFISVHSPIESPYEISFRPMTFLIHKLSRVKGNKTNINQEKKRKKKKGFNLFFVWLYLKKGRKERRETHQCICFISLITFKIPNVAPISLRRKKIKEKKRRTRISWWKRKSSFERITFISSTFHDLPKIKITIEIILRAYSQSIIITVKLKKKKKNKEKNK